MAKSNDDKTTKHHIYWPKRYYKDLGGVAKRFCQVFFVMLPWAEHLKVHRFGEPPPIPDEEYMRNLVKRYEEFRQQKDKIALKELREQEWFRARALLEE